MGAPELLALSLGLSVGVAGLAWIGGRVVETLSADPHLRDRAWAAALTAPALPPAVIGLMLLTPAPVREIAVATPVLADLAARPLEPAVAAVATRGVMLDPAGATGMALALASLLALARTAALAWRAGRLARMVRSAQAPDGALIGMVESAARGLDIPAPRIGVSEAVGEALLAGVRRPLLLLPVGLAGMRDAATARAVIAHELAHLKRGDHRALWIEEGLLAALAINPLMPALRARRAAAREEACDAVALAGAAPEIRRTYAETLIEVLRSRAGPQVLPALSFTGAGRRTAMHRLKAVMTPAPAAGRGPRLTALAAGLALLAAAGGATAAIAAHREVQTRVIPAAAAAAQIPTRELLNGAPLPAGLPLWALTPERVDVRTSPAGATEVDLILPLTSTTPLSIGGRRMPEGFPISGLNPDAIAQLDLVGDHMMVTLKSETEYRGGRGDVSPAADAAEAAARAETATEERTRFQRASAADYKRYCASDEPGEYGFCGGVMFRHLAAGAAAGLCIPEALTDPARSTEFVTRGGIEVARLTPRRDEGAYEYAGRALAQAYPCSTRPRPTVSRSHDIRAGEVQAWMSVELGEAAAMGADEHLRVALVDERGAIVAETVASVPQGEGLAGPTALPLARDAFPRLGEASRVYQLIGEIRGSDGAPRRYAEPVTIRLGPGSEATARDLTATLSFPG